MVDCRDVYDRYGLEYDVLYLNGNGILSYRGIFSLLRGTAAGSSTMDCHGYVYI